MIRLFLLLILFTTPAMATVQWRDGTGANTLLGTSSAADIDTNTFNNIVSPLDSLLANYREGLNVNYSSASQLTVTAGSVTVSNSDGSVRLMLRNPTSTTVTWSDIDTGAEASGTTYYVYAIAASASSTTATFKISASSTTPSGVTYWKRLGSFVNDGSSNIGTVLNDNHFGGFIGDYTTKSAGVTYQALTDGIVSADGEATATANMQIDIYADSSSSPSTVVRTAKLGNSSGNNVINATEPVKKGNYYKVTYSNASARNSIKFYPTSQ